MQRARRLLACAVVAVTVAACSGGDDDDATPPDPTERADPTERTDATDETVGTDDAVTSSDATVEPDDTIGRVTGADRDAFVAPLAENLRAANDALDDEQAECLAEAVVDTIGIGRLARSGMTPAEFADGNGELGDDAAFGPEDQDDLSAALAACGDLVDVFVVDEDLSREAQACIRGAANDATAAELMAAELTGATPSDEARQAAATLRECAALDTDTTTRPTSTTRPTTTTRTRPTTTPPTGATTTVADDRNRD